MRSSESQCHRASARRRIPRRIRHRSWLHRIRGHVVRVVQQIAVERANAARGLLYAAGRNDADSPGLIHALRRDCGRARTGAAPLPRNLVAQGSPQYVINSRGRRDTMAAAVQLAARRSHNPKVGSSILSCRIQVRLSAQLPTTHPSLGGTTAAALSPPTTLRLRALQNAPAARRLR